MSVMQAGTLEGTERWSGLALLFHNGLSLGAVSCVIHGRDTRTNRRPDVFSIGICAPFLDAGAVRGQELAHHLETERTLYGYCIDVAAAPWFVFELDPSHSVQNFTYGTFSSNGSATR